MRKAIRNALAALGALALMSGAAAAQSKVTIAVGGAGCLCYLPTVLAQELGEYKKAGVEVELVDFKGGSQALTAVIGGSADVVSGYFDHCVNLAAKNQSLEAFVVYDRYPGLALVVGPKQTGKINAVKDLKDTRVGVSAPGSSTDFFLKYLLSKHGVDPNSVGVVGIGLAATAVAAMEQGSVDAAVMLDPAITQLQARNKDLKILSDTRTQKDTLDVFSGAPLCPAISSSDQPSTTRIARASACSSGSSARSSRSTSLRRCAEICSPGSAAVDATLSASALAS